jgi:hypothetical protein
MAVRDICGRLTGALTSGVEWPRPMCCTRSRATVSRRRTSAHASFATLDADGNLIEFFRWVR